MNKPVLMCALVSVGVLAGLACGKTDGDKPTYKIVDAGSGLRMRDQPSTDGKVLGTIPQGTHVKLLQESGPALQISGRSGRWSQVDWKGTTGWVFGGFLSSVPVATQGTGRPVQTLPKGVFFSIGPKESADKPASMSLQDMLVGPDSQYVHVSDGMTLKVFQFMTSEGTQSAWEHSRVCRPKEEAGVCLCPVNFSISGMTHSRIVRADSASFTIQRVGSSNGAVIRYVRFKDRAKVESFLKENRLSPLYTLEGLGY